MFNPLVLGQTPIKTSSKRTVRRRLYATPSTGLTTPQPSTPMQYSQSEINASAVLTANPTQPSTPTQQSQPEINSSTRAGIIVIHKDIAGESRSGTSGVTMDRLPDQEANSIRVLWMTDGVITTLLLASLTRSQQPPPAIILPSPHQQLPLCSLSNNSPPPSDHFTPRPQPPASST